jgi:hypothetical protein
MRWEHSAYLFVLGCVAFAFGSTGSTARKRRWPGWLTMRTIGMSLSYIVLLTAFYIDNGPKLPLWDRLPSIMFWLDHQSSACPSLAERSCARTSRCGPACDGGCSLSLRVPRTTTRSGQRCDETEAGGEAVEESGFADGADFAVAEQAG